MTFLRVKGRYIESHGFCVMRAGASKNGGETDNFLKLILKENKKIDSPLCKKGYTNAVMAVLWKMFIYN